MAYRGDGDHSIYGSVGWPVFGGRAPQADGLWHHAALVTDGDVASLYIDGQFANSVATSNGMNVKSHENVSIGQAGGSSYLNGMVDEVMIFDRALSADEVKLIYDSQK